MVVSCIISEIKRDTGRKSWFFHTPLHSTPPLGGPGRNSAMTFGTEKLEWLRYPTLKKYEDTCIRFDMIHERDGRTHTNTHTAWLHRPRLCIASRGKNCDISSKTSDMLTTSERLQTFLLSTLLKLSFFLSNLNNSFLNYSQLFSHYNPLCSQPWLYLWRTPYLLWPNICAF